jgi:predicted phage tail protein
MGCPDGGKRGNAVTMRQDTRQLLRTALGLLVAGAVAAALMLTVFGGVTMHGPHTNSGWLALIVVMGCLPTGTLTLLLGVAKLIGDQSRKQGTGNREQDRRKS